MERGKKKGWIQPAVPLRDVPDAMRAQILPDPEKSMHCKPFEKFPEGVSEPDREALRIEGRRRIASDVFPAYLKLYAYFPRDYLPAARKDDRSVGVAGRARSTTRTRSGGTPRPT